ncbi:MAG: response regulator [Rhodopila sp.]|jgi:FixJ family two-component response regulator
MSDRRRLVLIVDDDQAVRDALQFALRLEGLCVHVHSGGAALLADPDLSRAGCVVLGDRMRQMDGFTLLRNLKDRDISLPAIMLTSHATQKMQARADAVGVRKVLEKPLLDDALMDNIRSILSAGA